MSTTTATTCMQTDRGPAIEDFEFHKPISQGAFGQVYLGCKKTKPDTKLAIKIMDKDYLRNKNMLDQAQEEKNALAILEDNPHVVKLFYCLQSLNKVYLVMEYLVGGDLKSLLEVCGCFNDYMIAFYTAEIALALKFLNDKKIVHRDIKPDNCLIDKRGHVKLTDFGLAKMQQLSSDVNLLLDRIQSARTPGQIRSLKTIINTGIKQKLNTSDESVTHGKSSPGKLAAAVNFVVGNLIISPSSCSSEEGEDSTATSSGKNTPTVHSVSPSTSRDNPHGSMESSSGRRGTKRILSASNCEGFPCQKSCKKCSSAEDVRRPLSSFQDSNTEATTSKCAKIDGGSDLSVMIDKFEKTGLRKNCQVTFNNSESCTLNDRQQHLCGGESQADCSAACSSARGSVGNCSFYSYDCCYPSEAIDDVYNCSFEEDQHFVVTDKENRHPLDCPNMLQVAQSAGESVSTVTTEKAKASFEAESKFTSPEGSKYDSVELFRHQTVDGEPFDGCYDSVRQRILSFKIETPDQKRPVECHSWVTNPLSFSMAKVSTPTVTSSDRSTDRSVSMDLKCPHTPFTPANTPYSRVKNSAKRPTRANPHVNHSSSTDRILGTPDYIAPEMVLKGNRSVSYAVDWWSLGVCMFEFATGVLPFNDETPAQVLENIIKCDIPWPTGEEELDEMIVEPIKALLEPDPGTRANLDDLKGMKLFECIEDWDSMLQCQTPPFVPVLADDSDTEYFRPRNEACNIKMTMSRLLQTQE